MQLKLHKVVFGHLWQYKTERIKTNKTDDHKALINKNNVPEQIQYFLSQTECFNPWFQKIDCSSLISSHTVLDCFKRSLPREKSHTECAKFYISHLSNTSAAHIYCYKHLSLSFSIGVYNLVANQSFFMNFKNKDVWESHSLLTLLWIQKQWGSKARFYYNQCFNSSINSSSKR